MYLSRCEICSGLHLHYSDLCHSLLLAISDESLHIVALLCRQMALCLNIMSWRDISIASNSTLWVMGASSTIIARHSDRVLASVVYFFIEQVGVSCWWLLRGTLNV